MSPLTLANQGYFLLIIHFQKLISKPWIMLSEKMIAEFSIFLEWTTSTYKTKVFYHKIPDLNRNNL